jgi:hypothetical protein
MIELIQHRSPRPAKFPITPEIHAQIKAVYQTGTGNGQVHALAVSLNYPRWKISRYALQMGWIAKQKKEPNWSDRELHILKQNAHRYPETIQRRLKAAGYTRSVTGIILKRKRERLLKNLDGMSACGLAECLGVDVHFIIRAINAGRLKAEPRGTKRTELQGGDIWWIRTRDIRTYILNYLCEIDLRKVDKYWYTDLLTSEK